MWLLGVLQKRVSYKIHREIPVLKSLPDTIKELPVVRLATLLKRHPHSGQKQVRHPTATLLKKRLWHRCFPVNFAKFLRTLFSQNTSGQLLLPGVSKLAVCRSYTKQVFLNNSQNSQENTYVRITFLRTPCFT